MVEMSDTKKPEQQNEPRRPWEPPTVKALGSISEVLQQGGGKPSASAGDPGEPRKVTQHG
jgi:hypothetical protein